MGNVVRMGAPQFFRYHQSDHKIEPYLQVKPYSRREASRSVHGVLSKKEKKKEKKKPRIA